MISRWARRWCGSIFDSPLSLLIVAGITPLMLSIAGLAAMILAGWACALNNMAVAGILILIGGALDGLDGELARIASLASESGGFIDSVCDHLGDLAIYFGICWRAEVIGDGTQVLLLLAAMFGSLFGSLLRARAGAFGIDLKDVGLMTRFERLLIVFVGVAVNILGPALWVLAVLTNVSAMQRLIHVLIPLYGKPIGVAPVKPYTSGELNKT